MTLPKLPLLLLVGWVAAIAMWPQAALAQETVRVAGTVRDELNAVPLPNVAVEVVGTPRVVYTDLDGRFVLELPRGAQEIKVEMAGYEPALIKIRAAGEERSITADVGLKMARLEQTVTVSAEAITAAISSAAAQLFERKNAQVIAENLGADEMRASGDSNAAAAMTRVTGLSLVDNQYVFVRGLGERYSNTTLNGSALPTTEPDKKVVPLDLFPSALLSSVSVAKSYTPDRSADFAGGLVEIVPLKFPNRPLFDFSYSAGFNTLTAGQDVITYAGGGRDWTGFDDGTRNLPSSVPNRKVIRGGIYTPDVGVLREDLTQIGRSFANNWNLTNRRTKPNESVSLSAGRHFGRVGFLGSYTQAYKEQLNTERQVFYRTSDAGLSEFSDYDFEYATRTATVGAVGNLSVQLTPAHRVTWENFYTHNGKDETRTYEGFNSDAATDLRNQRMMWIEEQLLTSSVTGEHFLQGQNSNSRVDWRATFSAASRDEPDLREVLYERNGSVFVLADESQSGLRMFNGLDDDTKDVAANWNLFRTMNNRPMQIKFGGQYVERTRDFDSRRFRFVPISTSGLDLTAEPGSLYTSTNIGSRFEIKEETRVTDAYAAEQTTAAFYGMTDLPLSNATRLIGGLRVERFDQQVDTFDLFDFEGDPDIIRASIERTDVFPSLNLIHSPRPNQNLRIGFSQTVNRPEFREVAPFEFTDVVGGRATIGNPDLKRALIQNYDVRYELFPGGDQVVAASVFFKRFDQPIERVVQFTAQLRTSFANAESARNAGFELETRRRIGEHLLVGGNYTFVESNVTLAGGEGQAQTSLDRPLAGQSKHLFNALGDVRVGPGSVRFLYNFFGKRISDVGSVGLPDIYEEGRGTLDLVFSLRLRDRVNVRVGVDNVTDQDFKYTQGGQIQRLFHLGRTVTFGMGFSGF
jgi:outer membrane receptor protein involved in Fe transport